MSDHLGLEVKKVSKSYGTAKVLNEVSFEVRPGEVVALLGENGAGKSTISSIIAGSVNHDSGTMIWKGQDYNPSSPGNAIQKGIGLIHQETRLLKELSVAENVFVGRMITKNGIVDFNTMNSLASEQLKRLGLEISPKQLVKNLKMSAQQQIEIAKALTLNSELLILDEPTSSLGESETNFLFDKIRQLKKEGVSFIYISHRLEEIEQIADKIIVLRDGNLVSSYDNANIAINKIVHDMVGRDVDRIFPIIENESITETLRVENLNSIDGSFENINFSNLAYPLLVVPFLSRSSEIIGKKILLNLENFKFLFNYNQSIFSNFDNSLISKTTNFLISFNQNEDSFDEITWASLYKISQKTFVDETESSKKNSAGAGLTDNDWV